MQASMWTLFKKRKKGDAVQRYEWNLKNYKKILSILCYTFDNLDEIRGF